MAGATPRRCIRRGIRRDRLAFTFLVSGIRLYTVRWCGFCVGAKALLERRGLPYEEVELDGDPSFRQTVYELGGQWTVPLVVIDGQTIGGYEELAELDRSGALAERLIA